MRIRGKDKREGQNEDGSEGVDVSQGVEHYMQSLLHSTCY